MTMPLSNDNRVIQGLWIGPALSAMEQLGIASYLANGHEFHLYVYDRVANLPDGTTVRDAGEILPSSRIFQYTRHASYAGFANFFRYKLLAERGGWWSDTDSVCLKPFSFATEYVFSSEFSKGVHMVNNGLIKAPAGSPLMEWAWRECNARDTATLEWGETGPVLMGQGVERFGLKQYVQDFTTFCPLPYKSWNLLIDPKADIEPGNQSYAVHLWNEQWRSAGADKDAHYHPGCLYERLRRRYLGSNERISIERVESLLRSLGSR